MCEKRPSVSGDVHLQILLATYNSSRYLREQLDSILAQDCRDFELLIRDGGSDDDTIVGGSGDDTLHGGGGDDLFCFCPDWGSDTVEQLPDGTVTLWFATGDQSNWNADTRTYSDGSNSVTVKGTATVNLAFGTNNDDERYATLASAGAFTTSTSGKIFLAAI